ncbi:DUF6473 family protein [Rhodosalinus sp. 5P4]|uniref:DUF6473 family protein n=1 Tax=Rhodosalinus sp. 5P4 TaxID=3239196 RepID=UPI0035249C94
MTYAMPGRAGLDYAPYRYGSSKLLFRGPRRPPPDDYVACLGGTETFGKFVLRPFPDLLEEPLGKTCLNFGVVNAGVDAFANDAAVLEAAAGARLAVVQVMGAQSLSNRFYSVHPRRNDRFVRVSDLMRSIFPEVDFTEFHFTGHMLSTVAARCPKRFATLREEMRTAWLARMRTLIERIGAPVVLLWFAEHSPDTFPIRTVEVRAPEPLFVTRAMVEALRPAVATVVEVAASEAARADGTEGMVFRDVEAPAARGLPGPRAHAEAAEALAPVLRGLLDR